MKEQPARPRRILKTMDTGGGFLRPGGPAVGGLISAAILVVATPALSQPVNDDFANRIMVSGETVQMEGSSSGAAMEPGEPAELTTLGGAWVWWEWTAPASGRVTISTAGSGFDTVLAIFVGDVLSNLSRVAENDDEDLLGGIFTSRLSFFARSGTRYSMAVGGIPDGSGGYATGPIRLQIAPAAVEPLPFWQLTTLDGKTMTSSALPGQIILLDFWATWCAPCRAEIPSFIELHSRYREAGLVVLGVSVDTDGTQVIRDFASELAINYPLALTATELERALGGVPSIPTAFILDSNNNLITRHVGFRERDFWEAEIKSLLADPEPVAIAAWRHAQWIELSWPASASDWLLQSTFDLRSGSWIDVTERAENREGQMVLRQPLGGASRYFRLLKP